MSTPPIRTRLLVLGLALALYPLPAPTRGVAAASPPAARDGRHDFDFEIGTWKTRLRRLVRPLTGSTTWAEYEGTSVVREVWGGRANLVELEVEGPAGRIQGLNLRLYDPQTRRWSLYFASSASGTIYPPSIGEFRDGSGVFYGDETLDGRPIRVRFVISDITPTSARFEQAFSADGGKTWEVNWIATDTRVPAADERAAPTAGDRRGTPWPRSREASAW